MKILKVKFNGGCLGKNIGCEKSPDLILKGIKSEEVKVFNGNIDETMKKVSESLSLEKKTLEKKDEYDILVGGDHSISYGSFKGFSEKYKNPGIIIFDAHPDCYPEEFLNHENWVYYLIKEGILKKENLILVGIRAIDEKEKEYLDKNKIKYFDIDKIFDNEEEICDIVMENAMGFDGIYLSIDIDVLDPAFAPGTGYKEINGLTSQQLFYFLRRIKKLKNLKRIDLVEINPDKDINNMTIEIGRKIIGVFDFGI